MGRTRRILTVVSVLAAAGVVPLVTATSASADQSRCVNYIGEQGYLVGPKVKKACNYPALHGGAVIANPFCIEQLTQAGVRLGHAQVACVRA